MSVRTSEEDSLLILLGENSIRTAHDEKSTAGTVANSQAVLSPKALNVPYQWDSLIEHSIMEPPCMCSARNTSVQQLGLSWEQDEFELDEDDSFLLQNFSNKNHPSKKDPIPLGRSTNLEYRAEKELDDSKDLPAEDEKKAASENDTEPETVVDSIVQNESVGDGVEVMSNMAIFDSNKAATGQTAPAKKKLFLKKGSEAKPSDASITATEMLEGLLLSAASSDGIPKPPPRKQKEKPRLRREEKSRIREEVDNSPQLLEKMNRLHSVLSKMKRDRKREAKKKGKFNIEERINEDPRLKEDMQNVYSMLKDVLAVQSPRNRKSYDEESSDNSASSSSDSDDENESTKPDAIDMIIDSFATLLTPVANFFGSVSKSSSESQPSVMKQVRKSKLRKRNAFKRPVIGSVFKTEAPPVKPHDLPKPGVSFSYSVESQEEEEAEEEPKPDLLDILVRELQDIGIPIDTSHSSESSSSSYDDSEVEDLTNFMVIGN